MENINTTIGSGGRFANHFFRNMMAHFISKNNNIKFKYSYEEEFINLGVELYKEGSSVFNDKFNINDDNFFDLIKNNKKIYKNIYLEECYCQTKEFSFYLKEYINNIEQKNKIIQKNLFSYRYNNNNDVFIHIRLDDCTEKNPGFSYYNDVLHKIDFDKGYISSDSISHPLCIALTKKYNLTIIEDTEIPTIMFGSTCKNIVLSNGTFSCLIGVLGFFSNVYFPIYPINKKPWHGDIFVFPEWNGVDISSSRPPLPYDKATKLMKKYGFNF